MIRLLKLETKLLAFIVGQERDGVRERDETLDWERLHMASCGRLAYIMAMEQGRTEEEADLAGCAAAIHDIGRILTGKQKDHAEAGYRPAVDFLTESGLFTAEEIESLSRAVKNHSRKTETGTWIEELVKDADVVDCYQYGYPFDRPEKKTRYDRWLASHGRA